jgi:type IV secretion system protein VirB6
MGALLFMLGTVGLLVTAKVALALLVALGPVFVVMALFKGTRGLFAGWLKGVVLLAIAPLFAVLGGGLMLELAVPILASLVATPGQVDPQAAMAFFMIGAVHMALMIMVLKVATTMVGGWSVFGLVNSDERAAERPLPAAAPSAPLVQPASQAQQITAATQAARRIDLSAQSVAAAANDIGSGASGGSGVGNRTTTVVNSFAGGAQEKPFEERGGGALARAQGIGSRFRKPTADTKSANGTAPQSSGQSAVMPSSSKETVK